MIKENLIPLFQVDAFTDKPFAGNPAAVCLLQHEAEFDWMRAVGAEMNTNHSGELEVRRPLIVSSLPVHLQDV
jgi:hypothetical protein